MFWCRSSRLTGVFIITLLCGLVLSGCKKEPEQLEPSTSDTNIISSNQVSEAPSEVSQIGEVSNSEKNLPSQSEQKPESENQVPETEVADSETKGPASEEQLIAEAINWSNPQLARGPRKRSGREWGEKFLLVQYRSSVPKS